MSNRAVIVIRRRSLVIGLRCWKAVSSSVALPIPFNSVNQARERKKSSRLNVRVGMIQSLSHTFAKDSASVDVYFDIVNIQRRITRFCRSPRIEITQARITKHREKYRVTFTYLQDDTQISSRDVFFLFLETARTRRIFKLIDFKLTHPPFGPR